jgi:transcriptional repressor NrdR
MNCPYCGFADHKVLDSRPAREGGAIRRRRECSRCTKRFTTFESAERPRILIVKRSGTREEFSPEKCLKSMLVACRKRHFSLEALTAAVGRIEQSLMEQFEDEAPSTAIGEKVLRELSEIDIVAYIRFASVYREFETLKDFETIIEGMRQKATEAANA